MPAMRYKGTVTFEPRKPKGAACGTPKGGACDDDDSDPDEPSAVEALIAPANDINSDDDDSDPDDHESDDMSVLWQTSFGV